MPIKFNVIERPEPGVKGGSTKKRYATVANNGEMDIDALVCNR